MGATTTITACAKQQHRGPSARDQIKIFQWTGDIFFSDVMKTWLHEGRHSQRRTAQLPTLKRHLYTCRRTHAYRHLCILRISTQTAPHVYAQKVYVHPLVLSMESDLLLVGWSTLDWVTKLLLVFINAQFVPEHQCPLLIVVHRCHHLTVRSLKGNKHLLLILIHSKVDCKLKVLNGGGKTTTKQNKQKKKNQSNKKTITENILWH